VIKVVGVCFWGGFLRRYCECMDLLKDRKVLVCVEIFVVGLF